MHGTRNWIAAVAVATVAALGPIAPGSGVGLAKERADAPEATADFEWSGRIPADGAVTVKGVNGVIKAGPSADGTARVTAVKRFRHGSADEVRIEVEEGEHGVTICAIYPGGRDCGRQTGSGEVRSNMRVDFTIEVPAGARLVASTVNGEVVATGLDGDADVSTVNGAIEVETRGLAEAHTVNGAITASIGSRAWPKGLHFRTVNGAITLSLPDAPNAELRASTVNGRITTDFPVGVRGTIGRHSLSGTLGRGGPPLKLSTVNGAIRLRSTGKDAEGI